MRDSHARSSDHDAGLTALRVVNGLKSGASGHWLDRVVLGFTSRSLFRNGWGELDLIENLHAHARAELLACDPEPADIRWHSQHVADGCVIRRGRFASPSAAAHLVDGIRDVPLLLVTPRDRTEDPALPIAVQLAGTGDEGFSRRYHWFAVPLAQRGIGSVILEQPYYGARRPRGHLDIQPRTVSELMAMTRAAMDEARAVLVLFLRSGYSRLAITGLSMGGQVASLVAGSLKLPIAAVPCLAPCVAGPVYFERICVWPALLGDGCGATYADTHRQLFRYLSASDVRAYPAPVRADAAVVVAAEQDAYVRVQDAHALHAHWQGSEFRVIPGGHISSFFFRRHAFIDAIFDAFLKLDPNLSNQAGVLRV